MHLYIPVWAWDTCRCPCFCLLLRMLHNKAIRFGTTSLRSRPNTLPKSSMAYAASSDIFARLPLTITSGQPAASTEESIPRSRKSPEEKHLCIAQRANRPSALSLACSLDTSSSSSRANPRVHVRGGKERGSRGRWREPGVRRGDGARKGLGQGQHALCALLLLPFSSSGNQCPDATPITISTMNRY